MLGFFLLNYTFILGEIYRLGLTIVIVIFKTVFPQKVYEYFVTITLSFQLFIRFYHTMNSKVLIIWNSDDSLSILLSPKQVKIGNKITHVKAYDNPLLDY